MPVPAGQTLDFDLFTTQAGWDETFTGGSSYAVSGGKGNITCATAGLNGTGLVRSSGIPTYPFIKYSMDFNAPTGTNHNFMLIVSTSPTFAFGGTFGAYINGGGELFCYDAGVVAIGFGSITNATYNVAMVMNGNYTMGLYVDDVLVYTSVNFSGPLITAEPLYFQVHADKCNGNGVLQIDNFLIADQADSEIEQSLTGGGAGFAQVGAVNNGVSAFTDSGLSAETEYFYRVRTNRGGDESPYSDEDSTTTSAAPSSDEDEEAAFMLLLNQRRR